MANERSLRVVTEPLPPACTPASVSKPWVHLDSAASRHLSCISLLPSLQESQTYVALCSRNYRTTSCYLAEQCSSSLLVTIVIVTRLVPSRGQGGLASELDLTL
jgi:hypothetical protein